MIQSSYPNIKNIHALACQGHDGVKIESHSLPLIGIATGLLIAFSSSIASFISPEDNVTTAYVELIFGALFLAATLIADYSITRVKRKKHNEVMSLIHKKVAQILLAIIGIALVLSVYMLINFGPGKLALWYLILVFGLSLFVIGQFSISWYTTNGVIIIAFSVIALIFIPHDMTLRLMTASLFILGGVCIPLFKPLANTPVKRFTCSMAWITIVVISGLVSRYVYDKVSVPEKLPHLSLNQFQDATDLERFTLNLPKDTSIRINTKLEVDAFTEPYVNSHKNSLSRELDIEIDSQHPTGRFRMDGSKWMTMGDGPFIRSYLRTNTLSPIDGPQVKRHHSIRINPDILD